MEHTPTQRAEIRHAAATPSRREAPAILRQREKVYEEARERHPRRWSKGIRDWSLPVSVWLNPVKKAESEMAQAA
jgi:putative transposase